MSPATRIIVTVAAAVLLISGAGYLVVTRPWSHGQTVAAAGGTAHSKDSRVTVTFANGQLSAKTAVSFDEKADAPEPPAGFRPVVRAFDIGLDHPANGGAVTVTYPPPAAGAPAPVMFILDSGQWRLVPSSTDAAKRTITGQWPHFSLGFIGLPDITFNPGDAASWVWGTAKSAGKSLGQAATDLTDAAFSGWLAGSGGTTDTAKCKPAGTDWTFTGSAGMTGCAGPVAADGAWPIKVNDRYPYPMLASLPDAVAGPGWKDLLGTDEPVDLVLSMAASLVNRLIVPAGKTVPATLLPSATDPVTVDATVDPLTLSARAVELIALGLTDGMSGAALKEAKAEVAAAEQQVYEEFIAARKAGSNDVTLTDYIVRTQGDDSLIGMRRDALARSKAALQVKELFDLIGLGQCVVSTIKDVAEDKGKSIGEQVKSGIDLITGDCFDQFLSGLITDVGLTVLTKLDPASQAEQAKNAVKDLVGEVRNLQELIGADLSARLADKTNGLIDFTEALVVIHHAGVNVLATAENATAAGRTIQSRTADSITVDGFTFTFDCGDAKYLAAGQEAMCFVTPSDGDELAIAIRALPGKPPKPDIVAMDGDFGQACDAPWALALLRKNGGSAQCP